MPFFQRVNHNSVIIYFGEHIDERLLLSVARVRESLMAECGDLIVELVPAYLSLLVVFDDTKAHYAYFEQRLASLLRSLQTRVKPFTAQHFEIPVYYAAEVAEDLLPLCRQKKLSLTEFIHLHSARDYTVYAVGFSPGFAYLGELDAKIAAPRLASPRAAVPAGSVGIAESQTGVYPGPLPGGWNIIGRTPLVFFDPKSTHFPIKIGDRVRFFPVDQQRYQQLLGEPLGAFQK